MKRLCLLIGVLATLVVANHAVVASTLPIPGAYHNYEAALDTDADNQWEDVGTAANRPFTFAGVTRVPLSNTGYAFSHAYSFPGTGTGEGLQAPGDQSMTATGLRSAAGQNAASFELWFRIDAADLPANDRMMILFETGGTTGLSLNLYTTAGGINRLYLSSGGTSFVSLSYDLQPADLGRFLQATATVDPSQPLTTLYVKGRHGLDFSTSTAAYSTWSDGGDNAGLGMSSSASGVVGAVGLTKNDPFQGEIAIFRHYDGMVLTAAQVQNNFLSQIPEPSTMFLLGIGGWLIWRRRRTK